MTTPTTRSAPGGHGGVGVAGGGSGPVSAPVSGAALADLLDASGLTGRGGAAFSTGVKVRAALEHHADLIVNACDGEVGAAKDAWVIAAHLPEVVRAAQLIAPGRRRTVWYAAHRGSATAGALQAAGVRVLEAPDRYISSEETALISLAHGGLARPMTKREPFVFGGRDSTGRRIRPTVVLNAETVWRIGQIAERGSAGASWFRSLGLPEEPGPRLVSVSLPGAVAGPVVVETATGTPLEQIIAAAGGLSASAEAVLIGGLGGAFVSASEARAAVWSTASLRPLGASLGPGVIEVLDPGRCPLAEVTRWLTYAAGESAGQCGPCMFGLPALTESWSRLVERPSTQGIERTRQLIGLLPGRGACHYPDGVARFTGSALRVFDGHLRAHASGRCPVGTAAYQLERSSHGHHG